MEIPVTPRQAASALPPLPTRQQQRSAELNWQVLAAARRAERSFRVRQEREIEQAVVTPVEQGQDRSVTAAVSDKEEEPRGVAKALP